MEVRLWALVGWRDGDGGLASSLQNPAAFFSLFEVAIESPLSLCAFHNGGMKVRERGGFYLAQR